MRRFGYEKFRPRPKTPEDWRRLYEKHKILLPQIKKISLIFSKRGPGQTGARFFKYYKIPPIKYWNKDLHVDIQKVVDKPIDPMLIVETKTGLITEIPIAHLRDHEILNKLEEVDKKALSPTTQSSNFSSSASPKKSPLISDEKQ